MSTDTVPPADSIDPARADRLERILWGLLVASLIGLALLSIAAVFLVTLGYDEAWNLTGILSTVRVLPSELATPPVVSSGGPLALAQIAVAAAFGAVVWPHRLVTLACLFAVCYLAARWGSRLVIAQRRGAETADWRGGALTLAGLGLCPGLAAFGASAFAAVPALLLVMLCGIAQARIERRWLRILSAGTLAGLAAATRLTCVGVFPALLVAACFVPGRTRRRAIADALAAIVVGAAVLGVCVWAFTQLGPAAALDAGEHAHLTGVLGTELEVSLLFERWMVSYRLFPFGLMVLATVIGIGLRRRALPNGDLRRASWFLLVPFAWATLGAWLLDAPIALLRYILPALASFALLLGFGLVVAYQLAASSGRRWLRVGVVAAALGCSLGGLINTARDVLHGSGNMLAWEWAGRADLTYFERLRHRAHQQMAADYLASTTKPDEAVLGLGLTRDLSYLTGRRIPELKAVVQRGEWDPETLPRRVLLDPSIGIFLSLPPSARAWIESSCEVEHSVGRYVVYRVTGRYPDDPAVLTTSTSKYAGHPLVDPPPWIWYR